MAKSGPLGKIKGMLRRWHSSSRLASSTTSSASARDCNTWNSSVSIDAEDAPSSGLQPVLVGKSRRRYLVRPDLAGHPVFRRLIQPAGEGEEIVVDCEVVLFEHLLWMLQNADSAAESLDEIAEFYEC